MIKPSRKLITLVIGALALVAGIFGETTGLEFKLVGMLGMFGILLSYAVFEARADITAILHKMRQLEKWKDPSFWTALTGGLIVLVGGELGVGTEVINSIALIIAALIPFIMKMFRKEEQVPEPTE